MHAKELVEQAMKASGKTSQNQIGEALGVSHVAVGKWLRGENCPTFEQACELAVMAGLPPVSTAASVRQHSLDGAKHRGILRQLAGLAAGVTLAVGLTTAVDLDTAATAAAALVSTAHNPVTLYIMSISLVIVLGTALAAKLRKNRSSKREIQLEV